uniref:radial spoke head 14 homolog n=1 Tax=Myxine glutinosa TaxID=7769 RepID=UPI00358FCA9F
MDDVTTECLNYLMKSFRIVLRFAAQKRIQKNVAFPFGAKSGHCGSGMNTELEEKSAVAIMNAGLIAKLVDLMKHSSAKVCKEALDTLHYCLTVDIKKPLLASEITLFKSLFAHEDHVVRAKAARNIMDASVCQEGVTEAIQQGIVPALVEMLADIELEVRACSAGAIMMLGVNIEGKLALVKAGAVESLLKMLRDDYQEGRLHCVKALTVLGECPKARETLLGEIELLERLRFDQIPAVRHAVKVAIGVITWKP